MDSGWKQSEVSPLRGIGGPGECEPAVEVDVMEIANVGYEPLHGDQQKDVGKNTVASGTFGGRDLTEMVRCYVVGCDR